MWHELKIQLKREMKAKIQGVVKEVVADESNNFAVLLEKDLFIHTSNYSNFL